MSSQLNNYHVNYVTFYRYLFLLLNCTSDEAIFSATLHGPCATEWWHWWPAIRGVNKGNNPGEMGRGQLVSRVTWPGLLVM